MIVFVFRYLDLFWNFLSIYNWIMKLIFIASSVSIVTIMRFGKPHKVCCEQLISPPPRPSRRSRRRHPSQDTYNKDDDAFPYWYLIIPAALLGIAVNQALHQCAPAGTPQTDRVAG